MGFNRSGKSEYIEKKCLRCGCRFVLVREAGFDVDCGNYCPRCEHSFHYLRSKERGIMLRVCKCLECGDWMVVQSSRGRSRINLCSKKCSEMRLSRYRKDAYRDNISRRISSYTWSTQRSMKKYTNDKLFERFLHLLIATDICLDEIDLRGLNMQELVDKYPALKGFLNMREINRKYSGSSLRNKH